jgi:class 3 adenylate cyclase
MLRSIFQIRVFISCPGDLEAEKSSVKLVCEEFNQDNRDRCNVNLLPLDWRDSVIPQLGPRLQETINESIGEYEVFVGILGNRFGTPTGAHNPQTGVEYESGTEEEFELAYRRWKESKEPTINFFFKNVDLKSPSLNELDQLKNVLQFKERIINEYHGWVVEFTDTIDFERKVRRFLNNLCWDIQDNLGKKKSEGTESPRPVRQNYEEVPNYLPRRVVSADDAGSVKNSYLAYENSQDTITVVGQKKRIVLLSDAGAGKSTELKRIAAHFSREDSALFPQLVSLNRFVNQSISELLPPGWDEVPDKRLLILLDGLDEVESQNRYNAIRQIELFAETFCDSHIVVSCRSNFYRTEIGPSSGSLKDFSSYFLLNLNRSAVDDYQRRILGEQKDAFERIINTNHLWSLLEIPFYLVRLVEQFQEKSGLPDSKADLFEQLIRDQIEFDIGHFRTTFDLHERQSSVVATLERVALAMEALSRNQISNEEYERIVPDELQRTLIKHYKAWNREKQEWKFDHNNFQEFLAARVLSRQNIETVKAFISFEPDYTRIIPSWVNTLSFLISILNREVQLFRELITWIFDNQPEIVVKFERDKIDPPFRVYLFKKIFSYYKERQIWIDRDKFDYSELARFGQSDESVDFLLSEAEQATHHTTRVNAIQLLGDSTLPHDQIQRATSLLVNVALNTEAGEHERNAALLALADLRLNSQDVINQILPVVRHSDSDWLRYGLYYLLYNSDFLDENIDVFLEGLSYVGIIIEESSSSGVYTRSRLFDEQWHLNVGLERASSPAAVKKILAYFKEHARSIDRISFDRTVTAVARNASVAYAADPSMLDSAIEFLVELQDTHDEGNVAAFIQFFDLTGTRALSFRRVFADRARYRDAFHVLALLADLSCVEFFVEQYEARNVTNDEVWTFQYHLGWAKSDLYLPFNRLVNEKSGNKFVPQPPRDVAGEKKQRRVDDIKLLFDKPAFVREVTSIFEAENKVVISKDDQVEIWKKQWQSASFSELAIRMIGQMCQQGPIPLDKAVETINKWDWDLFRLNVLYERMSHDKTITLTEDQSEIVAQWCYAHLDDVNFRIALITKSPTGGSTSWPAIFLWFFMRRLNLQYPENVLLDMLSFDWIEDHQWVGIEYLEIQLSQQKIAGRILENLEAGIENDDVLENHLKYCRRHSIREAVPFALREVVNPTRRTEVRNLALEAVAGLSEASTLRQVLPEIQDNFRWSVVDKLIELDSSLSHDFLHLTLDQGDESAKFKAAVRLMALQDLRGLSFYVAWIKDHKEFHEDDQTGRALRKLRSPDSVPLLMELLEVSYDSDVKQDIFHTLNRTVLDALNAVALLSDENYRLVRRSITEFINQHISRVNNVNFLYQYLESLERSFYINKSSRITLPEVIAKIRGVFDKDANPPPRLSTDLYSATQEICTERFRDWAGASRTTLALVFTDIVESTRLAVELGDERMAEVRRSHFEQARRILSGLGGYEIKTIGDSFMVAFRTAVDALDFVLELHLNPGDQRIRVRAGIHVGPVHVEEEDAFGTMVNFAARVVGKADGAEIWVSNEAKSDIAQENAVRHSNLEWESHADCELKGFLGKYLLWKLRQRM